MPPKNKTKQTKTKPVPFSTTLSRETKELLERFCKARGVRQNYFVETAILEALEDEMDMDLANARAHEPLIPWKRTG